MDIRGVRCGLPVVATWSKVESTFIGMKTCEHRNGYNWDLFPEDVWEEQKQISNKNLKQKLKLILEQVPLLKTDIICLTTFLNKIS